MASLSLFLTPRPPPPAFPPFSRVPQQQALTRRDFANEGDWQEYQATGMAPRQLEGRAKVVSRKLGAERREGWEQASERRGAAAMPGWHCHSASGRRLSCGVNSRSAGQDQPFISCPAACGWLGRTA